MSPPSERLGTHGQIGLPQAVAANVINMVGIGPFLTIPLIIGAMGGPQAMVGWALGALIALSDGLVWAELGAAMPGSGGSYQYLREAYGPRGFGRLMSFVFLFQSVIATPLLTASGAVGFADYAKFLFPSLTYWQGKSLAIAVCLIGTVLVYRNIKSVGAISFALFVCLMGTMGWIIFAGATHFHPSLAFAFPPGAFHLSPAFFAGLGAAALIAMYDYQGYCTVCLIGDEVRTPARTIPRTVVFSILLLTVCYMAMSMSVLGVVPWREAIKSSSIVSELIGRVQGSRAAQVSAVLIMIAAVGSVFTVLLGYTRVLYAAALEGQFFAIFARVHPKGFPSFAVLSMGIASAVASLLSLEDLISVLVIIQITTQFIAQCSAVPLIRKYRRDIPRPFSMYLYPVPVIIAVLGWLFILSQSNSRFVVPAIVTALVAVAAYLFRARTRHEWPFAARSASPAS